MTRKETKEKMKHLQSRMRRKHLFRINRGLLGLGDLLSFTNYRQSRSVKITLVPASWSHVLLLALANAFLVSVVRFFWFHTVGEPNITIADPQVQELWEKEYSNKQISLPQLSSLK